MIAVFLGAGFSVVGGVPLASQLFDERPEVDRVTRQKLVERVLSQWQWWRTSNNGQPEQSLAHPQKSTVTGRVPVPKLPGSVPWSCRTGKLIRIPDCRPAVRGDAAIVAPVTAKTLPPFFVPIWKAAEDVLRMSNCWVVVG